MADDGSGPETARVAGEFDVQVFVGDPLGDQHEAVDLERERLLELVRAGRIDPDDR